MRIAPISSTPFRGGLDLGKEITDALSKKLSRKIGDLGSDEFVPSTPSSPIMVEKIEIRQGESGAKAVLKNGGLAAGGAATGYGVGDLVTKKDNSIHKIFNGDDEDEHSSFEHESGDTDIEHLDSEGSNAIEIDGDDFDDGDGIDDMDD